MATTPSCYAPPVFAASFALLDPPQKQPPTCGTPEAAAILEYRTMSHRRRSQQTLAVWSLVFGLVLLVGIGLALPVAAQQEGEEAKEEETGESESEAEFSEVIVVTGSNHQWTVADVCLVTGRVIVVEVKARRRSQIGHLSSLRNAEIGGEGRPSVSPLASSRSCWNETECRPTCPSTRSRAAKS